MPSFWRTKPPPGTRINPAHPLAAGLIGCWMLNEGAGNLANDACTLPQPGILTNGPLWQGTTRGVAVRFDGVNDFISTPLNLSGRSQMTMEGLIRRNGSGALVYLSQADNNTTSTQIGFFSDGNAYIQINGAGIIVSNSSTDWQHAVLTFDGSLATAERGKFYLNGAFVSNISVAAAVIRTYTVGLFDIGKRDTTFFSNGWVNYVRVYGRALTPEEVRWRYQDPFAEFLPLRLPRSVQAAAGVFQPAWASGTNRLISGGVMGG